MFIQCDLYLAWQVIQLSQNSPALQILWILGSTTVAEVYLYLVSARATMQTAR